MKKICRDFGGTLTDKEAIETMKIARNTYFKYKKEIKKELKI